MVGALFLNVLNWGYLALAVLRYPIPIAVGLYYGGVAMRNDWGPIETLATGMFAAIVTGVLIQLALETQNVAVRSSAVLVAGSASIWVGAQVLGSAQLLLR